MICDEASSVVLSLDEGGSMARMGRSGPVYVYRRTNSPCRASDCPSKQQRGIKSAARQ